MAFVTVSPNILLLMLRMAPNLGMLIYSGCLPSRCIPTVLHQGLILEQESSGAVAIMAVLFSFSIVMALAGWYSFYNLRNERMQYSSLVDANQGL